MTTRVTAVPIGNKRRYVTKIEPGMKVFELQLDAVIQGESQTLSGTLGLAQQLRTSSSANLGPVLFRLSYSLAPEHPSVPTMMRHRPAGSLDPRA